MNQAIMTKNVKLWPARLILILIHIEVIKSCLNRCNPTWLDPRINISHEYAHSLIFQQQPNKKMMAFEILEQAETIFVSSELSANILTTKFDVIICMASVRWICQQN